MERNTVKDRLIAYLSEKKLSKAEFGRRIGASSAFVTSMRKSMQPDKIERIAQEFPDLNIVWLQTGEGEMLKGSSERLDSSPCFDITTIQGGAGHGTGMEQITTSMVDQAVGRMMAPGLPTGGNIPYIQVRGNSMLNRKDPSISIPDGAWVGIRASTLSTIMWGEVYAIMTTDGPIIKKVVQSDKEDCIRCVSYNEEDGFAPFDLPFTDIIPPLYNVLAVVNIKLWT